MKLEHFFLALPVIVLLAALLIECTPFWVAALTIGAILYMVWPK